MNFVRRHWLSILADAHWLIITQNVLIIVVIILVVVFAVVDDNL